MTARIIYTDDLFHTAALARDPSLFFSVHARENLRRMALDHPDLTVAAVAAKLVRKIRGYTPENNGGAA